MLLNTLLLLVAVNRKMQLLVDLPYIEAVTWRQLQVAN
jgi:hypothetical protein